MLIEKDKTGKSTSTFLCDRCNRILTARDKCSIYIQEPKRSPKKKWDLCERCYNSLVRGIEKGVQKK